MATNLDIVQTFGGFLCANFSAQNTKMIADPNYTLFPAGLTYFNRLNCVISNGKPGHLQFYSIKNEKLLFNVTRLASLNQLRLVNIFYNLVGHCRRELHIARESGQAECSHGNRSFGIQS